MSLEIIGGIVLGLIIGLGAIVYLFDVFILDPIDEEWKGNGGAMIELAEGQKVGACIAVSRAANERSAVVWTFRCECGRTFTFRAANALSLVRKGKTFTCRECRERTP